MSVETDDDYIIEDVPEAMPAHPHRPHWIILVVDDDEGVHSITRVVLGDVRYQGRPIKLLSAYSAAEAERVLWANPDISVVLLDVVMEADDAGLKLVHIIRQSMGNRKLRIILRTGQPGQAPERDVILGYDINDYKSKTELTAQKLFTATIAALRSYSDIVALDQTRRGLERIIAATTALSLEQDAARFNLLAVSRLPDILGIAGTALLYAMPDRPGAEIQVIVAEGPLARRGVTDPTALLGQAGAAIDRNWSPIDGQKLLLRPLDIPNYRAGALVVIAEDEIPADRVGLVDIYASSLAVGLRNVSLQESLRAYQASLEQQVLDRTADLTRVNDGLKAANARINADLEVAKVLQQSILPSRFPQIGSSRGHAVMRAAHEIGGDFFDVFQLDEKRIGVVVGDVCGKGVAAALFMVIARTIIRNVALEAPSVRACIARANDLILEQNPLDLYLTVVYGILDTDSGVFSYTVGGHDTPVRLSSTVAEPLPRAGGMLVGLIGGVAFEENAVQLQPGDSIVLFTDGVTEAFDMESEAFGEERLLGALASLSHHDPERIVAGLIDAVDRHAAGQQQSDDITCLVVRYGS